MGAVAAEGPALKSRAGVAVARLCSPKPARCSSPRAGAAAPGGEQANGGNGGHTGAAGQSHGATGGGGGTASAGGLGGAHATAGTGPTTTSAIEGVGGQGGVQLEAGGGGGGGYYGGGGGGGGGGIFQDGGGGGGSSTVNGSSSTSYEDGAGGAGGDIFGTGAGGEITISFAQPATATSLSASSASPPVGSPVIYTATVSPVPTSGTVAFTDNGASISGCEAQPVNTTSGIATCEETYNSPGAHSIVGSYSGSGDTIYPGSTSASKPVVATQSTTITLTASNAAPAVGQSVTYTATVVPAPDSGTVTFSDGGVAISGCEAQPVSPATGVAKCQATYGSTGRHVVTATFSGSAGELYAASSTEQGTNVAVAATTPTSTTQLTHAVAASNHPRPKPILAILTRASKPLINRHRIFVRAVCSGAACRVSASATVRLPGSHDHLSLRTAATSLTAGKAGNLVLAVPRSLRQAVREFLRHHRHDRLKLTVTVSMTGAGGVTQREMIAFPIRTLPGFR